MNYFKCIVIVTLCCVVEAQNPANTSPGFFGLFNLFRRTSTTIPVEVSTETSVVFLTATETLFQTETEVSVMTVTETDTSTMSLSWLRWTTETEREFLTETVTETTTTVDVSLLVSVAVVTLTERSTVFLTTTATILSGTTKTIYSDLTFTEPAPKCPTYTVSVQKMRPSTPELKDILDIDDIDLQQPAVREDEEEVVEIRDPFKEVDIDDLDLVEGFLRRSSGALVAEPTALPRIPHILKNTRHLESSFANRQRHYNDPAINTQSTVMANLMFSD